MKSQLNENNNLEYILERKQRDIYKTIKDHQDLSNNFLTWQYEIKNNEIKDVSFLILSLFGISLLMLPIVILALVFRVPETQCPHLVIAATISIVGINYYLRNLKIGLFKNKYKKWLEDNNKIKDFLIDSKNIFSLLLHAEEELKKLQNKLSSNEEIKKAVSLKIEIVLKKIKQDLTFFDGSERDTSESVKVLNKILTDIENSKIEILETVKYCHLNQNYKDYKKTQGIIEDITEKNNIENNILEKFKALL